MLYIILPLTQVIMAWIYVKARKYTGGGNTALVTTSFLYLTMHCNNAIIHIVAKTWTAFPFLTCPPP